MKIIDAKLYQELIRRESKFKDNIDKVFNYSEDFLPQAVNVFNNYTQHDVDHSIAVMNYMFEFINDINQINDLEITIMIYTALLHDIGMVVIDDEIKRIKTSDQSLVDFKYSVVLNSLHDEKLALQECIRPIHAKRSAEHISHMETNLFVLPNRTNINFIDDVQKICQSHNESFEWLKMELSQDNFKGDYSYNAQYIAILLRLADLLDIDELRTPLHLYQLINPKSFSDLEWKQHFVIANTPKVYTNSVTNQKEIIFYGESTDKGA